MIGMLAIIMAHEMFTTGELLRADFALMGEFASMNFAIMPGQTGALDEPFSAFTTLEVLFNQLFMMVEAEASGDKNT